MAANLQVMDDFAVDYLKKHGSTSGEQLYGVLCGKFPALTEDGFAELVQRLASHGQIDRYEETKRNSWVAYLNEWDSNLWFYASVVVSVLAAATAYLIPGDSPLVPLRWVLGLVFVLFLPGYVMVETLFPTMEIDSLARIGLSVGLSLILDMFAGLALNYTPYGIRLVPVLLALSGLTICLAFAGLIRQFETSRRRLRIISTSL